jgi:hypothetical protein
MPLAFLAGAVTTDGVARVDGRGRARMQSWARWERLVGAERGEGGANAGVHRKRPAASICEVRAAVVIKEGESGEEEGDQGGQGFEYFTVRVE